MSRDHALLIDTDEVFQQLLRESLETFGIEVLALADAGDFEDAREFVDSAALILIAVDLPAKDGFGHFTQARSLAPRVPTVLVTSTLSGDELSLHAKLRKHADLYLDKRLLTQEILARALAPLAPDLIPCPDAKMVEAAAASADSVGLAADERTRWLVRGVADDELDALAAAITEEDDAAEGGLTPARFARIQAKIERLELELGDARRAAASSPFSEEFRSLSEGAQQQAAQLTHLRVEIGHRDAQLQELQRHIEILERDCVAAIEARNEIQSAYEGLAQRAEQAEQQALRLERGHQELVDSQAGEMAELSERLRHSAEQLHESQERERVQAEAARDREEQARAAHDKALAELRHELERDLRSVREAETRQLEAAQRDSEARLADAVAQERTRAEELQAELQRTHGRELEELRRSSASALQSQAASHAQALAAQEREADRTQDQAAEAARAKVLQRLVKQERAQEKAIAGERKKHERALDEWKRAHHKESEGQKKALAAARAEFERNASEAKNERQNLLNELRRAHETELETCKAEAERARAEQRKHAAAELESAVDQARSEAEKRLQETMSTHAAELSRLVGESSRKISALQKRTQEDRTRLEHDVQGERETAAEAERLLADRRAEETRIVFEKSVEALKRDHSAEIERLNEAKSSMLEARRQDAEAAQLRAVIEHERLQRVHESLAAEQERLQTQLAAVTADAERLDNELDKARVGMAKRDDLIDLRDRELGQLRETIVSLRALFDDLQHAVDSLGGLDPTAAAGAASILRSVVRMLGE